MGTLNWESVQQNTTVLPNETSFVRPIHLGAALGVSLTYHLALVLRDVWKDGITLIFKVTDVE